MIKNKKEGLSQIANETQKKPILICLVIGFILVISVFYFGKKEEKPQKISDETYSISETQDTSDRKDTVKEAGKDDKKSDIDPQAMQQEIVLLQQKQKQLQERLAAPLMLVNNQSASDASTTQSKTNGIMPRDANMQFMQQVSQQNADTMVATKITSLNDVIIQGALIHVILEPAINSDLPGYLRATVSETVYSADGTRALIPIGSSLIGQYKSGMYAGQSRIFIVWIRLITPDGTSIQLASPGVDSLGRAGIEADEIDRHFFERFGTAALLSMIKSGVANVGVNDNAKDNSANNYRSDLAQGFGESANDMLQQDGRIPPTLKEHQGKEIIVFVAHDLNFQTAFLHSKPSINIF